MWSSTNKYCIHGLYKNLQLQASFPITLEITICCKIFSILWMGKLQVRNEMQFFHVHWFIQTLSDLCCVKWCKQPCWSAHLLELQAVTGVLASAASRQAAVQMEGLTWCFPIQRFPFDFANCLFSLSSISFFFSLSSFCEEGFLLLLLLLFFLEGKGIVYLF